MRPDAYRTRPLPRRQIALTLLREGLARLPWLVVIGLSGAVLFVPSTFLPPLSPKVPILQTCQYTELCSTRASPWGIVTGLFLYDGWNNADLYLQLLVIFGFANFVLAPDEIRRRSIFTILASFGSAIVSAALWLGFEPASQSFGPSAVVYAFIGVVFGTCIFNIVPRGRTLNELRKYYSATRAKVLLVMNAFMVSFIACFLAFYPAAFLSVGPHVNVFEHGVSFLLALSLVYACLLPELRSPSGNTLASSMAGRADSGGSTTSPT